MGRRNGEKLVSRRKSGDGDVQSGQEMSRETSRKGQSPLRPLLTGSHSSLHCNSGTTRCGPGARMSSSVCRTRGVMVLGCTPETEMLGTLVTQTCFILSTLEKAL